MFFVNGLRAIHDAIIIDWSLSRHRTYWLRRDRGSKDGMDGVTERWIGRTREPSQAASPGSPRRIQTTIRRAQSCDGVALHSGAPVSMSILPAPDGHGIVFRRTDLGGAEIPARYDLVADTRLCTLLASPDRKALRVGTIEHLMAAFAALGVDNAIVEVDGPELPILDGSALPYLELLARAGLARGSARLRTIEVLRRVRVEEGPAWAELTPASRFGLDVTIAFAAAAIGTQRLVLSPVDAASFREALADCRTFTDASEIERLHAAGLARGGSLANAIVVDGDRVLNPEGLRHKDEFVRHKALDMVGDLALAGHPLRAHVAACRPGHGLNNRLLRALFAEPANWRYAGETPHPDAAPRKAA